MGLSWERRRGLSRQDSERLEPGHCWFSFLISRDTISPGKRFFFFKKKLFLIGGYLLYNIVLVSAIYQHESVIGICMSPPSRSSLLPPTPSHPCSLSQSTGFELPMENSLMPDAVPFTWTLDCLPLLPWGLMLSVFSTWLYFQSTCLQAHPLSI